MSSMAASAPISSVMAYSGSSYATILFDQSKIRERSPWGTPMSSAMAWRGSSTATRVTKSKVPSASAPRLASSTMAWARSRSAVSRFRIARG